MDQKQAESLMSLPKVITQQHIIFPHAGEYLKLVSLSTTGREFSC